MMFGSAGDTATAVKRPFDSANGHFTPSVALPRGRQLPAALLSTRRMRRQPSIASRRAGGNGIEWIRAVAGEVAIAPFVSRRRLALRVRAGDAREQQQHDDR